MTNHLHVLFESDDPSAAVAALARTLGHWTRRFGPRGFGWEPIPAAEPVRGRGKILRAIRYVALNPCRAGLCADPLEWAMSTHRDAIGAVADPWCGPAALRRGYRARSREELRAELQAWISGDPSVNVAGTAPPRPAAEGPVALLPLVELARAAAAATRALAGDIRLRGPTRDLFVALSLCHGWANGQVLAEACSTTMRTIQRIKRQEHDPAALEAATLCLGDARLRGPGGLTFDDEWSLSRPEGRRRSPPASPPAREPLSPLERLDRWFRRHRR